MGIYEKQTLTIEEINESFINLGVDSAIHIIIGEWVVSKDGDIMCLCKEASCYIIFSYQLNQMKDWREHLNSKDWFKENSPKISEDFELAMNIARTLKQ